ncbi:hypothetical protein GCM10007881_39670 [Mesorhizobium huakuii]|nr:hypothetical protein GCM10007881_39670 [Mesorhizobium huakuii]
MIPRGVFGLHRMVAASAPRPEAELRSLSDVTSNGAPDFEHRIAAGMSFVAGDVATVASPGNSIAIMPAVGRYGAEAAVLTPPFE